MTNVLISGASVAGPALAYWLHRHGMRATVVEKAAAVRPGGLGVDFRGSAMLVLERMGILDELRRHATGSGDATIVAEDGTPIATMPGEIFAGELEVLKTDLTRILHDLTKAGTEYVFGDSITALTQHDGGVDVEFAHGAPRRFDLVIGADGLHSGVRALAFSPESAFTRDLGYWFASFSLDNYLDLDRSGLSHLAGDRAANIFASRDNTEARAMFMFPTPATAFPRGDVEAQKRVVADAYAGVGWEVPRLLAAMAEATDFYSTRSARSAWTPGPPAGSRCSAMPATARRRCPGAARRRHCSARTSWPASWPARSGRPPTTRPRSPPTSGRCAGTSR
ncbi:MAG: FAD-dependent oxidoreductase [Actinophytocola sp.]|nr:FAD-dependent monooxygenase [Actinophytocola sp.]MPZ85387.1 FAD-dependent oxidoreductase [Actinophytocola sp.]